MSVPGTNLETDDPPVAVQVDDPTQHPPLSGHEPEPEPDDDGVVEAVSVGGQKMVPLAELIKTRKEAKAAKAKLAELEPQVAQIPGIQQQIDTLRPYADAIRQNPNLIKLAQQATRPSGQDTVQPDDDQEARDTAEDLGLYHPQTGELDVARARRGPGRADREAGRRGD